MANNQDNIMDFVEFINVQIKSYNYDLRSLLKDELDNLPIDEFFSIYSYENMKKVFEPDNIDSSYFVCITEKDSNIYFEEYIDNPSAISDYILVVTKYLSQLTKERKKKNEKLNSCLSKINISSLELLVKVVMDPNTKCELKNLHSIISCIDVDVLEEYIYSIEDEEIIAFMVNNNINLYNFFVNNDSRALRFIDKEKIDFYMTKYIDRIKYSPEVFKKLTKGSIIDARERFNRFLIFNPSLKLIEKFKEWEDKAINDYYAGNNIKKGDIDELIIDRLFDDNYYNVMLNIGELIRYYENNDIKIISQSVYEEYMIFANFADYNESLKYDIYDAYKDQKLGERLCIDLINCRRNLYHEMNKSFYVPNNKDEEVSKKYGVDVYKLDGEPFNILIRCLKTPYTYQKDLYRECFSVITDTNASCLDFLKYKYGYLNIPEERVLHVFETDSFSSDNDVADKFVNRLMNPYELQSYEKLSELQIKLVNNQTINPSYIIALDKITESNVEEAHRLNLPIVLINTLKYNKTPLLDHKLFDTIYEYIYSSPQAKERAK